MKKLRQLFQRETVSQQVVSNPEDQIDCRLVLLGTGGSGKTAIMKRSVQLNTGALKSVIYGIMLNPFYQIFEFKFEKKENSKRHSKLMERYGHLLTVAPERVWSEYKLTIFELYQDEGFKKVLLSQRRNLSFMESLNYFTKRENFERILQHEYDLTDSDIFFAALLTTGVNSSRYVNNPKYEIEDTGGQRTERKKWQYLYSLDCNHTKPIVFGYSVSLSEFDELCSEDGTTSRYLESLKTFSENYDTEMISNRPLYLIFGKFEVLEEKIRLGISFSEFVPEYNGDDSNVSEIVEFIVKKYLELDVKKKVIKHYVISARKTEQVYQMLDEIFEQNQKKP